MENYSSILHMLDNIIDSILKTSMTCIVVDYLGKEWSRMSTKDPYNFVTHWRCSETSAGAGIEVLISSIHAGKWSNHQFNSFPSGIWRFSSKVWAGWIDCLPCFDLVLLCAGTRGATGGGRLGTDEDGERPVQHQHPKGPAQMWNPVMSSTGCSGS